MSATSIRCEHFGRTLDGKEASLFTLSSDKGVTARITNYGGIITSLESRDKNGKSENVVLGFDSLEGYLEEHPYFGAVIGRFGNRIAKGRFVLDGKEYSLPVNNGPNSLHGGLRGFDKVTWNAEATNEGLRLHYVSTSGEEGYPGNLTVTVTYRLDGSDLVISYEASTDAPTIINLTNHSYFNLEPQSEDALNHAVTINADRFTPVDADLIPTGEIKPVEGTPMDFRAPHRIGERVNSDYEQIFFGGGYDHNYVINGVPGVLRFAGRAESEATGRVLEVFTTEPGMQFYSGNFLDGTLTGAGGKVYGKRSGFCFETQHYPDSPNKPEFPATVLRPGQRYESKTVFRLGTR